MELTRLFGELRGSRHRFELQCEVGLVILRVIETVAVNDSAVGPISVPRPVATVYSSETVGEIWHKLRDFDDRILRRMWHDLSKDTDDALHQACLVGGNCDEQVRFLENLRRALLRRCIRREMSYTVKAHAVMIPASAAETVAV